MNRPRPRESRRRGHRRAPRPAPRCPGRRCSRPGRAPGAGRPRCRRRARARSESDEPRRLGSRQRRRAVHEDDRRGDAPARLDQVGDGLAHRERARSVTRPCPLAPTDQPPDQAGHPRETGSLGVVVGHVVHEAPGETLGGRADDGQHDERLRVEHVRLRGRHLHGIRPRADAPGVGEHLQEPPERVAEAVDAGAARRAAGASPPGRGRAPGTRALGRHWGAVAARSTRAGRAGCGSAADRQGAPPPWAARPQSTRGCGHGGRPRRASRRSAAGGSRTGTCSPPRA